MPPIMRQLFAFAILLIVNKVRSAEPPERPPSIYEWIEENAHICRFCKQYLIFSFVLGTSIPADGHNIVNFLTPSEGAKCSLCPGTIVLLLNFSKLFDSFKKLTVLRTCTKQSPN